MQHLTLPELKLLLRAIPQPRHRLMVKVTFHHGLRVSETLSLTGSSIRGGFVACRRLKGSLPTVQPYIAHPDPELDEYMELTELATTLKPGQLAFPMTRDGFLKLMKRAGRRAGISGGALYNNKLHPHSLKHSIAMATIDTAGIHNVKQWLGHKSMSSTGEYLKVTDEQAAIAISAAIMSPVGA